MIPGDERQWVANRALRGGLSYFSLSYFSLSYASEDSNVSGTGAGLQNTRRALSFSCELGPAPGSSRVLISVPSDTLHLILPDVCSVDCNILPLASHVPTSFAKKKLARKPYRPSQGVVVYDESRWLLGPVVIIEAV